MQFTVPQFIEHEAKILGSLTFKQVIFIGSAGAICFFLFFTIGKTSFFLFLVLSLFILGAGVAMALLKIGGQNLPTIFINFLRFNLSSKLYIWQKKKVPITVFKKEIIKKEVKKEGFPLKITEESLLEKIRKEIETKTK